MKVTEWISQHPGLPATVQTGSDFEAALDRLFAEPGLRDIYVVDQRNRVLGHLSHRRIAHLLLFEHRFVHTRRQLSWNRSAAAGGWMN